MYKTSHTRKNYSKSYVCSLARQLSQLLMKNFSELARTMWRAPLFKPLSAKIGSDQKRAQGLFYSTVSFQTLPQSMPCYCKGNKTRDCAREESRVLNA